MISILKEVDGDDCVSDQNISRINNVLLSKAGYNISLSICA